MRKVELVDQQVRPCNFNDFYYYPKHFDDKGIEAIHEMVRKGGYEFEKGGTGTAEEGAVDQSYSNNRDIAYVPGDRNSWWLYNELEKLKVTLQEKQKQLSDIQEFQKLKTEEINMLVKSVDLPKYSISTTLKHQYNKKANLQTRLDYDPINIAPPGLEQGNYFPTEPGEYDRWAVEFAYKPDLTDEERAELLALSVLPAYTYGTDGDAMGTPGRNIDPRTRRGDMSNDVVTYTADRFITLDNKIAELPEIYADEGETKNDFTNSFYSLVSDKGRFMDIVAGQVGGVYVTRLVNGQDEVNAYEPVPYAKQKEAMNLITSKFFANGVWAFDPKILKNLQREKRATGYSSSGNEDPQLHDMVLGMQGRVLASLLHPNVMTRLVDSAQYGNTYMPAEVLQDLFDGIFVKGETPDTFKRNLQSVYVDGLISVFAEDSRYDDIAKASVFSSLVDIQKFTKGTSRDPGVKAHYRYLNWKVSNFLDGKVFNLLEEE